MFAAAGTDDEKFHDLDPDDLNFIQLAGHFNLFRELHNIVNTFIDMHASKHVVMDSFINFGHGYYPAHSVFPIVGILANGTKQLDAVVKEFAQ
jgi:hypothetical protein